MQDQLHKLFLCSGESGVRRTKTTNIAMQYLASVGGGSGREYEIIKTNPILEAFGNAKTSRNNNSSSFVSVLIHKYILLGCYHHLNFVGIPVDSCDCFEVYSYWRIGCQATK